MIAKLKRRFTVLATVSMLLLMSLLVTIMNAVNYSSVVKETDTTLDVLAQPNAPFFEKKELQGEPEPQEEPQPPMENDAFKNFIPHGMSFEVPYESRFFSVTLDENGDILSSDFSRIISVSDSEAASFVSRATSNKKSRGFIDSFRFLKTEKDGEVTIYFLDCGRKLDAFTSFLRTSVLVGLLGCVLVFVAFLFISGKIAKPIADSYEKQKRFISDAGHEIKTPLTIISANADLLEADGEKEELTEIKNQTKRLASLTRDLVLLSKMEEQQTPLTKVDCPFSDMAEETVYSFRAPILAKDIELQTNVEKSVSLCGSPDMLQKLLSVLLENAVKYTEKNGKIGVTLKNKKKNVLLSVYNTTGSVIAEGDLSHLFDRFYRTDASRNSATGGHGIGLSIAKAIVDAHGGSISASFTDGVFTISISLPR